MSAVAKKASAVNVPAGEYLSIPVDEISVASNVRRTFDEERLAELAASVREKGILEPLLVRPLDGQYGRVYELVCGERRLRASRIAGLAEVPCRVVNLTAKEASEIQLLENLQRVDLNTLEEAQALSDLMFEHDYTQEQLAQKLGKSQPWVASRVRLLDLPESVRNGITRGIVNASAAEAMMPYAKAEKVLASLVETMAEQHVPVSQIGNRISQRVMQECHPVFKDGYYGSNAPKFEVGPCQNCESMIRAEYYSNGTKPWCTNLDCWRAKQKAAEEAEKSAAMTQAATGEVVDLSKLDDKAFHDFGYDETPADCKGCPDLKRGTLWGRERDICMKPGCYNKRKREAEKAKVDADEAAIADVMVCLQCAGYVERFAALPAKLRVLIASLVFSEVRPPSNEAEAGNKKVFRKLIGWDGQVEKWYLCRDGYPKLTQTLESMDAKALAEAVFHWLFWGQTPKKQEPPLKYLFGPISKPMEIPDDVDDDPEDPEDDDECDGADPECDGDCAACTSEREPDDESEIPATVYAYAEDVLHGDAVLASIRWRVIEQADGMWCGCVEKGSEPWHPLPGLTPRANREVAQKDLDDWAARQHGAVAPIGKGGDPE